jgi:hypothetical protein
MRKETHVFFLRLLRLFAAIPHERSGVNLYEVRESISAAGTTGRDSRKNAQNAQRNPRPLFAPSATLCGHSS